MEHPGANQVFSKTPTVLVIFGATGDLMEKKLLPALLHLHRHQLLPGLFQIVGFSRRELSNDEFRRRVREAIAAHTDATPAELEGLCRRCFYAQGLFDDQSGYANLARILGQQDRAWKTCANKIFYLAVPQQYFPTILRGLAESGLTKPCSPEEGFTRVVVEKPFGKDLASAEALDRLMGQLFKDEQVYRIDHYLGKETVQNILAFRFSNSFFASVWQNDAIERMDIQLLETSGAGGRGGFYDDLGALRDVGQNHLLQLLSLFAMENPGTFDAAAIGRERQNVLEALVPLTPEAIETHTLRGQYRGFRAVKEVKPDSTTETYFRIKTYLNTPRFAAVPIHLESGKKLDERFSRVTVTFKHAKPCLCPPGVHYQNVLRYTIEPREQMTMSFWVKKPGVGMTLEEKDFSFDYRVAYPGAHFFDAYEKLLLDVIAGDRTLFVTTGEILASWKFIDPIIRTWMSGKPSLIAYAPGSRDARHEVLPADQPEAKPVIGFIGLGKMGQGLVNHMAETGWRVVAYNRTPEKLQTVAGERVTGVTEIGMLVSKLTLPRVVWLMVTAGQAVDELLFGAEGLARQLTKGDVVIDGGNSNFADTIRRARRLAKLGIRFLDIGVSGGPRGARRGACLMIGGDRAAFEWLEPCFRDVAVPGGYMYFGSAGAGHFVKMVHNGIEYGMMQALAEGFTVMKKSRFQLDLNAVAELYNHGSVVESRLVGWLQSAFAQYGEQLQGVSGSVAHTGEGEWTVKTAKKLKVPVPIIEGAYKFRVRSTNAPSYTGKILSALRNQFGGHDVKSTKRKTY